GSRSRGSARARRRGRSVFAAAEPLTVEEVLLGQHYSGSRLRAIPVAAGQRDHVRVVILIEEQEAQVQGGTDIEFPCAATFAVPALGRDLFADPFAGRPVQGDEL